MLSYGCTRLEIGLQSIYEDVARDTNRGHTVAAVGDCFRLAKNAGFKASDYSVSLSHRPRGIVLSDVIMSSRTSVELVRPEKLTKASDSFPLLLLIGQSFSCHKRSCTSVTNKSIVCQLLTCIHAHR